MMLPIPHAGVLRTVDGEDAARAVPGITGLEITVPRGRRVVPVPEGDRYLGFLFARGRRPPTWKPRCGRRTTRWRSASTP